MRVYELNLAGEPVSVTPSLQTVIDRIASDWHASGSRCIIVDTENPNNIGNARVSAITEALVKAGVSRSIFDQRPSRMLYAGGENSIMVNIITSGKTCRALVEDAVAAERANTTPDRCDHANNSEAGKQNNIGILYSNGWGVPRDPAEAVRRFRAAAEGRSCEAMLNLAGIYQGGAPGIPPNMAEARHWMERAAALGDAQASSWLRTH